jgi:hypothetical protein
MKIRRWLPVETLAFGTAAVAWMAFGGLTTVAAGGSSRAPALSDHLAAGSGYAGIAEAKHADGSVTDTFAGKSADRIVVSGVPGISVAIGPVTTTQTAQGTSYSRDVAAGLPPVTSKDEALRTASEYLAAGRSVVQDAINVGLDSATAQRLYGHLMVRDDRSQVAELPGAAPVLAASSIYTSWCASTQSPDAKVKTSACDVEYLDQAVGYDWYMVDKVEASGQSTDTSWYHERLSQIIEWVTNAGGNQVVNWKPSSTVTVGSCTSITISLNGQSGASYSETNTICTNSLSPAKLNTSTSAPSAGGTWQGLEGTIFGSGGQGQWEASESEDLVHSPSGVPWAPYLHVTQVWASCFC